MKLAIGTGGAAFLMGVCLACNGVLGIDSGVPREVACGDVNWAHWSPKDLRSPEDLSARYCNDRDCEKKDAGDTVFDLVTGLQWQRDVEPGQFTWEDANDRCDRELDGYDDWRLPSRIELVSIVDYEAEPPAIPDDLFDGTDGKDYLWSSSVADRSSSYAWCVHAYDGNVAMCGKETCSKEVVEANACKMGKEAHRVRCVRTWKPTSGARCEFAVHPGIVIDKATGLTWQHDGDIIRNLADATARCTDLDLAGLTSWRLPTVQELHTIVEHAKYNPVIDPRVFGVPDLSSKEVERSYWSSTDYRSSTVEATDEVTSKVWQVDFWGGYTNTEPPAGNGRVRCVHGP